MKKLIFKSCVVLAICVFLDPRDFAALVFLTSGIFLPHSAQSLLCCSQPGLGPVRPGFRFRVGYSEWPQPGSWFLYLRSNFLSRLPGFLFSHGNSCRADLVSCSELAAALFGFRVICFLLGVRWAGLISRKIFLAASLSLGFLFPASIFGLAPISFGSRPRWFSVAIGFSCSIVPPRRPFSLRARPGLLSLRVLGLLQFFSTEFLKWSCRLFSSSVRGVRFSADPEHCTGLVRLLVFVFASLAIFVPCCLFLFLRWIWSLISQSAPVCSLDFGSWSEQRAPLEPVFIFPVASRFLLGAATRVPGVLVARSFPAASKGRRPDPV
jgi:hypothetical protein